MTAKLDCECLSQSESSATASQDVAATDTFLNRLSFVAESEEENSEGRVRCCGRTWGELAVDTGKTYHYHVSLPTDFVSVFSTLSGVELQRGSALIGSLMP